MRRPLATLITAILLLAGAAPAATDLQWVSSTGGDVPVAWAPFAGKTVVVTDGGIRIVDWVEPPGQRGYEIFAQQFDQVRMVSFGDSLFIYRPGLDSYVLLHEETGAIEMRTREAGWHLASNRIAGDTWFVDLGPEGLAIHPAPGEHDPVGTVDFATAVLPHDQALTDGDRAVVARRVGNETRIQILDLSDPTSPVAGPVITRDESAWVALRGRTLMITGALIESYAVDDIAAPALLNALGPPGEHREPSFRSDGVLAVWRDGDIRLVDASRPDDLRPGATLPAVLPAGEDAWPLRLEADRLVTLGEHGLQGYDLPAAHYVLLDIGIAWWRPEGSLLATDGRYCYLQGDRRYVLDLQGPGGRIAMLGAVPAPPPSTGAFLGLTADHLIYADGGGDVVIDDVGEPLLPTQAAVIDLPTQIRHVSLDPPFLSLVRTGVVDLYDLSDPAAPQHAGDIISIEHPTQALVHGDLLFILDHVNGIDDRIHVLDLAIAGPPPTIAAHDLAGDAWLHRVIQMTCRGHDLLAQVVRTLAGDVETYTLRLDLSDPDNPTAEVFDQLHYFWGDWSQPPVELVGFHVTVEVNNLFLNDYQGDPVGMPILDILNLPSRVRAVSTCGNELVAHYGRMLARCTVSANPPVTAPAVATADPTVRAVPNPFNPRTTVAFEMARAGVASVEVFDLRGRRVRSLRAELPVGPARLTWDGTGDDGRASPSGTYLVHVVTPTSTATTRCALVR